MSVDTIQYAFVAGEVSPTYYGRQDLDKYDLGLELAKNWFVDYRGGISTRPGTKLVDYVQHDDKDTKFAKFRYAPDVANSYLLLFGDHYIRFVQQGAYVLEDDKAITSMSVANPGVVTSASHGYATGDWVKIGGRTFEVGATTTNTFALKTPFGANFNTAGETALLAATAVARIYTLATDYAAEDLYTLSAKQHLNEVTLTHKNYAPAKLSRTDHANWSLSDIIIENTMDSPTNLAVTTSNHEGFSTTFAITAVDKDGNESLPTYGVGTDLCDFSAPWERISYSWDAVADAVSYNVYQTRETTDADFTSGAELGFLGRSHSLSFVNNNILPDFTATPPQGYNPFVDGPIETVVVTNGGSGYDPDTTTVTITDATPGAGGFVGFPTVRNGVIETVVIINHGKGYAAPTVVFGGVGSSAAGTATVGETGGNFPALFAVFQQRGVYAATENDPLSVWGSKIGAFTDFSYSDIVVEDDSYQFTLDAEELSPIRHMIAARGGLLLMTQGGIWLLTGGNDTSVSPINALADPQTYNGVSRVPPLSIGPDILYVEGKGSSVKLLSFNDFSKVYGGISVSILANHLFKNGKEIVAWSHAESPHNIVWAVRSDGAILPFTYVKEQSVYAWTQCWTKGLFKDCITVQEDTVDVEYLMVQRFDGERYSKFIEMFMPREIDQVEDAWCADCALSLGATYPNSSIYVMASSGNGVHVASSTNIFSASDVGKILRSGGGKMEVTSYISPREIVVDILRPLTILIPEDSANTPQIALSGEWTLDAPVSTVGGLWHLEGQEVCILADGNVQDNRTVVGGAVTLDNPATRVVVGLPFTCVARNLPLTARDTVIEDKRKRVVGLGVRINDTRGLKTGASLTKLYAMKERTDEAYGEPTRLRSRMAYGLIESNWNEDGQSYFVQEYPLPATVLGFVQDFEVGDDND